MPQTVIEVLLLDDEQDSLAFSRQAIARFVDVYKRQSLRRSIGVARSDRTMGPFQISSFSWGIGARGRSKYLA